MARKMCCTYVPVQHIMWCMTGVIRTKKLPVSFCAYVRERRLDAGWSLRELADRAGISLGRAWSIEHGNDIGLLAVMQIAKAYGEVPEIFLRKARLHIK